MEPRAVSVVRAQPRRRHGSVYLIDDCSLPVLVLASAEEESNRNVALHMRATLGIVLGG